MTKIEKEKSTITLMVHYYCKKKHSNEMLCSDCESILTYALGRLNNCIYGESKPACSKCMVHCYKKAMREQISNVMRFVGPRMVFLYPWITLKHYLKK